MHDIKRVNILVDNDSWILNYAIKLYDWCNDNKIVAKICRDQEELIEADASFFLGCTKIVHSFNLKKSRHNLVVHESDLPEGKGFAPVAWQILEGRNVIPVCLIEASQSVDSGDIWLRKNMVLDGTELHDEWRSKQGLITIELCQDFISDYNNICPEKQSGTESFYTRRTPKNSELNIEETIAQQFNLLRTVDNKKYPAFFVYKGKKYKLEVSEHHE